MRPHTEHFPLADRLSLTLERDGAICRALAYKGKDTLSLSVHTFGITAAIGLDYEQARELRKLLNQWLLARPGKTEKVDGRLDDD